MFEVGFTEILLICALALIVLGPEKLPRLVAQLGRWAGRARAMARQFRDQLDREVEVVDLQQQYNPRNDGRDHSDAGATPDEPSGPTIHPGSAPAQPKPPDERGPA